jgi:hypothetical protein
MAAVRTRKAIAGPDLDRIAGVSPLASVSAIRGVRVFDVGQGDSIAVLGQVDGRVAPVLQLDYGGRQGSPFKDPADIDGRMPVPAGQLLMLSHWDEDHWCTAKKGSVAKAAKWLVPRQVTSPRAVLFSAGLEDIHCIPERYVGQPLRFSAPNGDYILCEKIGPFAGPFAKDEDCNRTGVAMAVVRLGPQGAEAILLPGDAPFDKARIFTQLAQENVRLRGIVAFHHGAGTHWTEATEQLLTQWPKCDPHDVIFSCSATNSYGHPDRAKYGKLLPNARFHETANARAGGKQHIDMLF